SNLARSAKMDTVITTTKVPICTGIEKPKNAATAAKTAPALMKAQPKCGSDTSRIAATSARPSQVSAPTSAAQDENSDERMDQIIDGRAAGLQGVPATECRAASARSRGRR